MATPNPTTSSITPITSLTPNAYPPPYIIAPLSTHNTTLILLHGTSTSGPEFAASLITIPIPTSQSQPSNSLFSQLPQLLPTTKFVFPTGKLRPTTVFGGRESNAWFDISTFSDRTIDESKQIEGIRESVAYLKGLVKAEVEILGDARRVIVGGFSQGCAMVGMLMLSGELDGCGILGGWVGMSGWLPFRVQLEGAVRGCVVGGDDSVGEVYEKRKGAVRGYLRGILGIEVDVDADSGKESGGADVGGSGQVQRMWMGHGVGDTKVPVEWGVQMKDLMLNLGFRVEMKTYEGLGHWYEGGELRNLVDFLEGRWVQYLDPTP